MIQRVGKWARVHKVRASGLGLIATAVVVTLVLVCCSWVWRTVDDGKAQLTTKGPYTASLNSLRQHEMPRWWRDAKFGVMLHWGPYSVPGYAPKDKTLEQLLVDDYDHAVSHSPYAEDYDNAMKDPTSPTAKFHRKHYGNKRYKGFADKFEQGVRRWDPNAWAKTFADAGARYVVVTGKYADGYSMWPSKVRNPHAPNFHAERDLVGELARAVRARGMKFGVYYSGGIDRTFQPETTRTMGDYAYQHYGDDYRDYAEAQVRELIRRYQPDILWNDIAWLTGQKRLNALFADYYNTVPHGVVNDRWHTSSFGHQLMGLQPMRWGFDCFLKTALQAPGAADQIKTQQPTPHSDFATTEYTQPATTQRKPWENDRGIGGSFGYNRAETDSDYASFSRTLLPELVGAASKNGNYLLNVGPSGGSGTIVPGQLSRLKEIGDWLDRNDEAVRDTRPWRRAKGSATDGTSVRFTRKGEDVYVVVLGRSRSRSLDLRGVKLTGATRVLGGGSAGHAKASDSGTAFHFDRPLDGSFAPVIRIDGAA